MRQPVTTRSPSALGTRRAAGRVVSIGIALQIAGRYYRFIDAPADGLLLDDAARALSLRFSGTPDPLTLEIRLEEYVPPAPAAD